MNWTTRQLTLLKSVRVAVARCAKKVDVMLSSVCSVNSNFVGTVKRRNTKLSKKTTFVAHNSQPYLSGERTKSVYKPEFCLLEKTTQRKRHERSGYYNERGFSLLGCTQCRIIGRKLRYAHGFPGVLKGGHHNFSMYRSNHKIGWVANKISNSFYWLNGELDRNVVQQ